MLFKLLNYHRPRIQNTVPEYRIQNTSQNTSQNTEYTEYRILEILNIWLGNKVITWTEELNNIIREWSVQREKPQPEKAKAVFYKLTKKKYPGP
jgi:hypothetical protein